MTQQATAIDGPDQRSQASAAVPPTAMPKAWQAAASTYLSRYLRALTSYALTTGAGRAYEYS